MTLGIRYKLLLMLLLAITAVVGSMFALTRWSFDRGFSKYMVSLDKELNANLVEALAEEFAANGSWDGLRNNRARWLQIQAEGFMESGIGRLPPYAYQTRIPPPDSGEHRRQDFTMPLPPPGSEAEGAAAQKEFGGTLRPFPKMKFLRGRSSVVVVDRDRNPVVGDSRSRGSIEYFPIEVGGTVEGYLGVAKRRRPGNMHDALFSRGQARSFTWIALVMAGVSLIIVLPLSHQLLKPIRRLSAATRELASGNFTARIPVDSGDELGALSRDFNTLARTLEENEAARRQWIADISHELRTPLAVLRGKVEAMQDGVHDLAPDRLGPLHAEVLNLGRLVDDLYQLSLSDLGALSYQKTLLDPGPVLQDSIEAFRREFDEKNIRVQVDSAGDGELRVFADRARLQQLFSNLLSNSLRYTDPGGELRVAMKPDGEAVTIDFQDTAPGVPEDQLSRLFDRLFRVDPSRSRSGGGSGLGLAICLNIVKAHDGSITTQASPLGGLRVTVTLPGAQES